MDPAKNDAHPPRVSGQPRDTTLEQALQVCVSSCLEKCLSTSAHQHPDTVWMRLYAASERLRVAVHQRDAAQAIVEIGSNLMGCEEMGILVLDQGSRPIFLVRSGITAEHEQGVAAHARELTAAVGADEILLAGEEDSRSTLCSELGMSAFVPIWHDRRPRGAIVFYRFLAQRNGLDPADRELLELLSIFSGPSLFSERPDKASQL